jgi:hypothetical protein
MNENIPYRADKLKWEKFLRCWEIEVRSKLAALSVEDIPKSYMRVKQREMLRSQATKQAVESKEGELAVRLPQSYVDFLSVSNGLTVAGIESDDAELSMIENVDLFSVREPELFEGAKNSADTIGTSQKYADYSANQDPTYYRADYMDSLLQISEVIDGGVFLANPRVLDDGGEWEIWFYSHKLPGAYRFRSFASAMQYLYFKTSRLPTHDRPYERAEYADTCAERLIE